MKEAAKIVGIALLGITQSFAQSKPTMEQRAGDCSINAVGSNNRLTIDCKGIDREQGKKILSILKKILANQLDPEVVNAKLDELIQSNASSGVLLNSSSSARPRFEIGDSGGGLEWDGPTSAMVLKFFEDSALIIDKVGDHIAVSTQVRDESGKIIAEIQRNEWKVRPSLYWDRNYNNNSLEIRDETGDVVLQIVALPDRIRIQGIWRDKSGEWLEMVKSSDGHALVLKGPTIIKISPIFMYPSERHFGELTKP